jgi:hypothetical protein
MDRKHEKLTKEKKTYVLGDYKKSVEYYDQKFY